MDLFEQTCKQIDAEFDAITGNCSRNEPGPVMLIRAAAKLIMSRYPCNHRRTKAMADLFSSAEHLKAMEEAHADRRD